MNGATEYRTEHTIQEISRRALLKTLGIAVATLVLPGCGGGSGSSSNLGQLVTGIIAPNTFGTSSSNLVVLSPVSGTSQVNGDGSFSVRVSSDSIHPILFMDSANMVWGMTLSIPGQTLVVNTESSLLAAIFTTPGLYASDQITYSSRLQTLRTLPAYSNLLTYFSNQAVALPLSTIANDTTFQSSILACIQSLFNTLTSMVHRGVTTTLGIDGGATINIAGIGKTSGSVVLMNNGRRYLAVDRIDKDASGSVINPDVHVTNDGTVTSGVFPSYLAGVGGLEITNIFQNPEPGSYKDPSPADYSTIATSEYWFQGLGLASSENLPSSLTPDRIEPAGLSIALYAAWPTIQIIAGKLGTQSDLEEFLKFAFTLLPSLTNSAQAVYASRDQGTWKVSVALYNFTIALLNAILESGSLVLQKIIDKRLNERLLALLNVFEKINAVWNLATFADTIISYPGTFHITVSSTAGGGVTIQ